MPDQPSLPAREPVLTAITGVIIAALGLLAAFGLAFTAAQIAAIVAFVTAVYGIAVLVRSQVTPNAKVDPVAVAPEAEIVQRDPAGPSA